MPRAPRPWRCRPIAACGGRSRRRARGPWPPCRCRRGWSGATWICAVGAAVRPTRRAEANSQNVRRMVTSSRRHYIAGIAGRPDESGRDRDRTCAAWPHGARLWASTPSHERPQVPTARLPGRRPRSTASSTIGRKAERRRGGPNVRPVRPPAPGAFRPRAHGIRGCPDSAKWRGAPAAARSSTRRFSRAASAPSAARICARARSASTSIPALASNARSMIAARVSPKDVANDCVHYSARTNWERETSSAVASKPSEPSGAKKAFDDLFKF